MLPIILNTKIFLTFIHPTAFYNLIQCRYDKTGKRVKVRACGVFEADECTEGRLIIIYPSV